MDSSHGAQPLPFCFRSVRFPVAILGRANLPGEPLQGRANRPGEPRNPSTPNTARQGRLALPLKNRQRTAPLPSAFSLEPSAFLPTPGIRLPHIPPHLLVLAVLFAAGAAQAGTGSPDATPGASGSPASFSWELLIPVLVPVGIAGLKMLLPKIPSVWLPVIAPVIGAALEIVLHFAGLAAGNGLAGALLGSAGVGLREILDQLRKLQSTNNLSEGTPGKGTGPTTTGNSL